MEETSSGQTLVAHEEAEGEQDDTSNVLTVRETNDQEMGLAVAILELIGSKPHAQENDTTNIEAHQIEESAIAEQVQVLEVSQGSDQQGLSESLIQDRNVVAITEMSESQQDAIHALESLVQIGQQDFSSHPQETHTEQVVIQFSTGGEIHDAQLQIVDHHPNPNHASLSRIYQPELLPPPKMIAVPPVTHTTTSHRTRSKVVTPKSTTTSTRTKSQAETPTSPERQSKSVKPASPRTKSKYITYPPTLPTTRSKTKQKDKKTQNEVDEPVTFEKEETSDEHIDNKNTPAEQIDTGIGEDGDNMKSVTTQQLEEEKEEDKVEREEKEVSGETAADDGKPSPKPQITPRKRSYTRRKSTGPRSKKKKSQVLGETEETENENSTNQTAEDASDGKNNNIAFPCPTCMAPFTRKDNLKVHMRKQHQEELINEYHKNVLTCFHPECGIAIYHSSKMIEHMEKEHGLVYQKQHLEFESLDEFHKWKAEEEASKIVQFSSSSKEKQSKQGCKFMYYKCQRDGNDKPHRRKGELGRLTDRKFGKGSVKSNIWCPARINAKYDTKSGLVSALYISSHSHPISYEDTKHHRLPEPLRKEILAKFARGISVNEVYNDLHKPRDMENNSSPLINKQHMITKRFLYMLRSKATASKKFHDDEGTSVRILVENLRSEAFNPVLMFKAANEVTVEGTGIESCVEYLQHVSERTYILVIQTKEQLALLEECGSKAFCIDATHADNPEGSIQLVTLFVADVYQKVYPVGYLVTNKIDDELIKAFLITIKNRCSKFRPSLVMTDVDNSGLKQLEDIYGQESFVHLLSKWHIHQAWIQHLKQFVPIIPLRQEMYFCLVLIMEEKNAKKYEFMVNAFVNHYAEKAKIFTDFFQETFASRPKKWAACFLEGDRQSNKCLVEDYFHHQMKHFFTQKRKSLKRVDFLTTTLLEIAKNDGWCRKSTLPNDISESTFLTNHKKGMNIAVENIKEVGSPDEVWKVTSDSESHEVRKLRDICTEKSCYLKCLELSCFDLCQHLYHCSCVEEIKICQHIHRVHMLRVACTISVPEHMRTDHLDISMDVANKLSLPSDMELNCADQVVEEVDEEDDNDQVVAQIENLTKNCKEMFNLLKDKRVRQLLLQHVCGTVSDLVATCDAVRAGAVTVTYEQHIPQDEGQSVEDDINGQLVSTTSDGNNVERVAVSCGDDVVTIPIESETQ